MKEITMYEKQENFLGQLERVGGIVNKAASLAHTTKGTVEKWMKKDPNFKMKVEAILNAQKDYVESKLFENIDKGKESSIIFYLKCQHEKYQPKERLYVDDERIQEGLNIIKHAIIRARENISSEGETIDFESDTIRDLPVDSIKEIPESTSNPTDTVREESSDSISNSN